MVIKYILLKHCDVKMNRLEKFPTFGEYLLNLKSELDLILTDENHPLHFANDRTIARSIGTFTHEVQRMRINMGVLGSRYRKKIKREFLDQVNTFPNQELSHSTNTQYSDFLKNKSKAKIENHRRARIRILLKRVKQQVSPQDQL
jgi:hypothetical protein